MILLWRFSNGIMSVFFLLAACVQVKVGKEIVLNIVSLL